MVTKLQLQEKYDPSFPQLTTWRLMANSQEGQNVFWELSYRDIRNGSTIISHAERRFTKSFIDEHVPSIDFYYSIIKNGTTASDRTTVSDRTAIVDNIRKALRSEVVHINRKREEEADEIEAWKNMIWRPVEDMTFR
jgi:hypothetical protein